MDTEYTLITSSKCPTSESKVVGVYGLITSSPCASLPLFEKLFVHNVSTNFDEKLKKEIVSVIHISYQCNQVIAIPILSQ